MRIPTKAVYAGSFDPITNGHLYVILRMALLFDEFVVAVGHNPTKKHTFSVEKRVELIRRSIDPCLYAQLAHVEVTWFEANQFLVNYARDNGFTHIVRGLRDQDDFRDERRFMNLGLSIQHSERIDRPIVETVYFITPKDLEEVSSGAVKLMCGPKGWEIPVHGMVPSPVWDELKLWVAGGKQCSS